MSDSALLYQRRSQVGRNATPTRTGVVGSIQCSGQLGGRARLVREDELTSIAKELFYRERNLLQHDTPQHRRQAIAPKAAEQDASMAACSVMDRCYCLCSFGSSLVEPAQLTQSLSNLVMHNTEPFGISSSTWRRES